MKRDEVEEGMEVRHESQGRGNVVGIRDITDTEMESAEVFFYEMMATDVVPVVALEPAIDSLVIEVEEHDNGFEVVLLDGEFTLRIHPDKQGLGYETTLYRGVVDLDLAHLFSDKHPDRPADSSNGN